MSSKADRILLVLIVLLTLGFFSWNFSEFFTPDGVYYFGRRLDSLSDVASAFSRMDNRGQYRPLGLVLFSFLFYPLLKFDPTGYHVIPLLFHVLNVLLVYRIARELRANSKVALGAAFFFALHRVNFFVTFGITFLPDFLGCFFFLTAFLVYVRRRNTAGYWLTLVLWLLALGNKETAVVFPVVLLCYEWLIAETSGPDRQSTKLLKRLLPFAVLSLVFVAAMLHFRGGSLYPGDTADPYRPSLSVSSLVSKVKYLWWAANLPEGSGLGNALMPGFVRSASLPQISVRYPALTLAAAGLMLPFAIAFFVFVVGRLLRKDKFVMFGVAAFLLTLAPVLPLAGRVMHHNLYFSLFGLSLLMGDFLPAILQERIKIFAPVFVVALMFSTAIGVANKRHNSWPVTSARISKRLLERFQLAARSQPICESGGVLIARTGLPDFAWYSDGGNLFRVFGPCPGVEVYFEDLGQTSPHPATVRLEFDLGDESAGD